MVIDAGSRTGETPIFEQRQNVSHLGIPTENAQRGACDSLLLLVFLSLWSEGRQGEIERLKKGLGRLCDGVVYWLGSFAQLEPVQAAEWAVALPG